MISMVIVIMLIMNHQLMQNYQQYNPTLYMKKHHGIITGLKKLKLLTVKQVTLEMLQHLVGYHVFGHLGYKISLQILLYKQQ